MWKAWLQAVTSTCWAAAVAVAAAAAAAAAVAAAAAAALVLLPVAAALPLPPLPPVDLWGEVGCCSPPSDSRHTCKSRGYEAPCKGKAVHATRFIARKRRNAHTSLTPLPTHHTLRQLAVAPAARSRRRCRRRRGGRGGALAAPTTQPLLLAAAAAARAGAAGAGPHLDVHHQRCVLPLQRRRRLHRPRPSAAGAVGVGALAPLKRNALQKS
jgi:hypothetical protein